MDGIGEAHRLVRAVYGVLDLFSGSEADLLGWAKRVRDDRAGDTLLPGYFSIDGQALLARHLVDAGVLNAAGDVDPYALRGFQRVTELLPHFRAEEAARKPAPRPQVVLTVPGDVTLPPGARHLQKSLAGRISDALISANRRVLLASPFWSAKGNELLLPSLSKAIALGLPVTLAGARHTDATHHAAMCDLASRLLSFGVEVSVYTYLPPKKSSLFHAKVVAGRVGYLGSANLTASGLGEHVELGMPLAEVDVERVWWLIDVLVKAGVLGREDISTTAPALAAGPSRSRPKRADVDRPLVGRKGGAKNEQPYDHGSQAAGVYATWPRNGSGSIRTTASRASSRAVAVDGWLM